MLLRVRKTIGVDGKLLSVLSSVDGCGCITVDRKKQQDGGGVTNVTELTDEEHQRLGF